MDITKLYTKALSGNLRPVDLQPIQRQSLIEKTNSATFDEDAVKVKLSKASIEYSSSSLSSSLSFISNEEPSVVPKSLNIIA